MKRHYIRPGCLSYKRKLERHYDAVIAQIAEYEAELDLCTGDSGAYHDMQCTILEAWRTVELLQDEIDRESYRLATGV